MNMIETKNLTKHYPGFSLQDVNLRLPGGCILGLIGENGAGKSTTIRLLLGMLRPDGGSATLLGSDEPDLEDVGVVLDEPGFAGCLTGLQIDRVFSGIYRRWDSETFFRLLDRLDVPRKKKYKDLSRGTRMKLGIAAALAHSPRLLILDEATSGLDPVVRDQVLDLFLDFARRDDHAILISSHIVSDLEKLCDYIAFLHKGRLMLFEEKDALLEQYGMLLCEESALSALEPSAILGKRITPYGAQAIVRRSRVPKDQKLSPVTIEELFVFMAKEDTR